MKVYIVSILLLSLASALDQYSNLKTQVGINCASISYADVVAFDVTPWPPAISTSAIITIKIVMGLPNASVGVITYGTMDQYHTWSYQYQIIDVYFPQNSTQEFQYVFEYPNTVGNYITQVVIGSTDIPPIINSCWSFAYSIGA
ncbi:hypothetical protein SteCoe_26202 [Stentor coeruleus]|uniref:Uncharacterized protein n=1 Tax=Stentor coeruleus TaxID=5963 RepID=A0A1R2BDH6_9CILI|nr:hypothetical protein SteCoe_26202 [Stentor coeruleus]